MEGGAIIDRVGVQIGVEDEGLRAGLASAGAHIDTFAKRASNSLKFVAVAVGSMAAGFAALAVSGGTEMFRKIGDEIESIGVKAKTIGIMSSELQELGHAARRVDVDMATLEQGLQKFSVTLGMARAGSGSLASFLKETNPALLEQLKNTKTLTEALDLLATAHNNLGSQQDKLALTQAAFTRSGTDMTRVLALGKDGMRDLAREANQMGFVFDDLTIKAGGDLADALEDSAKAFDHQLKKAIIDLGPVLLGFLDFAAQVTAALRGIAREIAGIFTTTAKEKMEGLTATAGELNKRIEGLNKNLERAGGGNRALMQENLNRAKAELDSINQQIEAAKAEELKARQDSVPPFTTTVVGGKPPPTTSEVEAQRKEAERLAKEQETKAQALHNAELSKYNDLLREGNALKIEMQTPDEALAARQEKINMLYQRGAIDIETFGRAMAQASAFSAENMNALASSISSNLSTIFGESKGVAIATAVINTAQGVTRALAAYPPPISIAMAAIQAAAGAAQIAKIKSMTKSGGGGGGTGVAGSSGIASVPVTQSQMVNINLQGNNFSRDSVASLIGMINQQVKDGTKLIVSTS